MAIDTYNGKIIVDRGKLFLGTEPLSLKGTSATFPFSLTNNSSVNYGVNALRFVFNTPGTVTVDYGDGVKTTYNTYSYAGSANVFIITGNQYFTDLLAQHPIHYYNDGQSNVERTVKISYNKSSLIGYSQSGNMGFAVQPFNFIWAQHPALSSFAVSSANFITSINIAGLSSNTNPSLTALDLSFFNSTSPYYSMAPVEIFNMPLIDLKLGSPGYGTSTLDATKLYEIGNYPVKNTLVNLRIISAVFTAAMGIPTTWTAANLPALRLLQFDSVNTYTTVPNINSLTQLTTLRLINCNSLSSYGNFSSLVNLTFIDFQSSTSISTLGNFPSYFDSFTKLRSISYAGCGQNVQSVCTAIVDIVYNFITRNAPLTGLNNGTIPFRGMTINLTVFSGTTAVNGTIQAPAGFTLGSNNGSPVNAGEKIYVLRNQYATTITLTT